MTNPYETQAIANLQRYLLGVSRFDPDIPPVDIDGIFGDETRRSLEAFQEKYGLPITGSADSNTWTILVEAYLAGVEAALRPNPIYIFPRYPAGYSVGLGDEGILVWIIQLLLRDILILYGRDENILPIDGIYGERTEEAVRDFQQVHRLPVTGRVDQTTWNRMARTSRLDGMGE